MAELINTSIFTDTNLKAYYRFSAGALTTDSKGSNTLSAISDPAEVTGKFGGGVELDGNDAYSATDDAGLKPTGNFSIGCWIKINGGANGGGIFQSSNSFLSGSTGFAITTTNPNGKIYMFTGNGSTYRDMVGGTNICDNLWHLVVGTWDGSKMNLYLDQSTDATPADGYNPSYSGTNYVRVGCYNNAGSNAGFMTGSLDEVFLLNGTALTASQVALLYKSGVGALHYQHI